MAVTSKDVVETPLPVTWGCRRNPGGPQNWDDVIVTCVRAVSDSPGSGARLLRTLLSDIRLRENVAYSGNNGSKCPCKSRHPT